MPPNDGWLEAAPPPEGQDWLELLRQNVNRGLQAFPALGLPVLAARKALYEPLKEGAALTRDVMQGRVDLQDPQQTVRAGVAGLTAMGGGIPAAERGALGALGGRLTTKIKPIDQVYPQFAKEYPPLGEPVLMKKMGYIVDKKGVRKQAPGIPWPEEGLTKAQGDALVKSKQAYWGKGEKPPETAAFEKSRLEVKRDVEAGNYTPYFDVSKRYDANPQDFPAFEDTTTQRFKTDKHANAADEKAFNPVALDALREAFKKGRLTESQSGDWYLVGQLADEFKNEYGPEKGAAMFKERFADAMAATTGGADPTQNFLMAHYGNFLKEKGLPTPHTSMMPYPVGGQFAKNNMAQFDKMMRPGGTGVTSANPKPYNFSGSFQGNVRANTMDKQMMGPYGVEMPPPGSYGHYQGATNMLAKEFGVEPRGFQDVTWAGLKDFEGKPMIEIINEAIARTARLTGQSQKEVVRGIVRADRPVYGTGAPLPQPDDKEPPGGWLGP